jgi:phosphotransferase system HPr (HPr) family protein
MNGEIIKRKVTVNDPLGLHMRPVAAFAQRAAQFQCAVSVQKGDLRVNGKSILELMLLAAEQGTELVLEAEGNDAAPALDVLAELIESPGMAEEPSDPSLPQKG